MTIHACPTERRRPGRCAARDAHLQLVVVLLECVLFLLQDAGEWWDLQAHARHAVLLPDLRQDLGVKVHVELACVWALDQQRCLQSHLSHLDLERAT